MYCRNCGEKIDEYTKFCPKCGMKQKHDEIKSDHIIKKKNNSNIWIIVAILLIIISIWVIKEIAQREALRNIDISIDGINVRSIGLTSATLDIKLKMYNPNIITTTLDRIEYNLYGNDINLGNGIISQRVDIPSRTARTITTNFDISYGGTIKVIWSGLQQGNVNWKMDGVAHFDTLLGTIDIPFSKRQGESISNTQAPIYTSPTPDNSLIIAEQKVNEKWSQVENQYQRRADLIPNLIETVKGYATQESKVFTDLAEARSQWASAKTINEKIKAAGIMDSALSRLMVVIENYPQLKANENFVALQAQLEGTENRVTVARMDYNTAVREYNQKIKGMNGYEPKPFFEAEKGSEKAPTIVYN